MMSSSKEIIQSSLNRSLDDQALIYFVFGPDPDLVNLVRVGNNQFGPVTMVRPRTKGYQNDGEWNSTLGIIHMLNSSHISSIFTEMLFKSLLCPGYFLFLDVIFGHLDKVE